MQILFTLLLIALFFAPINAQDYTHLSYPALESFALKAYQDGDLQAAIPYLYAARKNASKEFGTQDSIYLEYTANLGFFYNELGQYENAELLMLEAKNTQEQVLGEAHPSLAISLNNLASLYFNLGYYEKAEPLFLQAKQIDEKAFGKDNPDLAFALNNLAGVYQTMGNYEKATSFYIEALDLVEKTLGKEHPFFTATLNNMAGLMQDKKNFDEAEKLYLQALAIEEKTLGTSNTQIALSLNNLGTLYIEKKEYTKAEAVYSRAQLIYKKFGQQKAPIYATVLQNLGLLNDYLENYPRSKAFYLQAIELRANLFNQKHPHYALSLNSLASLYLKSNQLDSARHYVYAAIAANSETILYKGLDLDLSQLEKQDFYSNIEIIKSLKWLLAILKKQYEETGNQSTLEKHYQLVKTAMNVSERIRNSLSLEEDKLRSLQKNTFFIQQGIESALALQNDSLMHDAFSYAELNKSILLMDALKGNRARNFGNLPDSLIALEISLTQEVSTLKKQLYLAKSDSEKAAIHQQKNNLQLTIDAFMANLKKQYPAYHALKYQNISTKAADIQQTLDDKTLLLEYLITDTVSYLFVLSKTTIQLYPLSIKEETLKKRVASLHFSLSNYSFLAKKRDLAYKQYIENAHWFYKNFLEVALVASPNIQNLIIITDGQLGQLPFGAFLTKPANEQKTNYQNLDYLINQYNISYNYAASLLLDPSQSTQKHSNNSKMLACASNYPPISPTDSKKIDSSLLKIRLPYVLNLRTMLAPLPSAQNEVESLSKTFEGDFYHGKACNERFFKENAANYGVIHLAMHGILDRRTPMLSSLAFTENNDSLEDNLLQAYEISRMKFNADLVVLSACETGYGKFEQGEGIISLARSFMYAGVSALVVSLWPVNDQSTAILMQSFYQNLAQKMPKDLALRQAKLSYIQSTEGLTGHPAFWAPFIQLGNSKPIHLKTKNKAISLNFSTKVALLTGGSLFLLFMGIVFYRKRKKR